MKPLVTNKPFSQLIGGSKGCKFEVSLRPWVQQTGAVCSKTKRFDECQAEGGLFVEPFKVLRNLKSFKSMIYTILTLESGFRDLKVYLSCYTPGI